jgi:hypothetical protein
VAQLERGDYVRPDRELGQPRGLGLSPGLATPAHFVAVWGSELVTLPALDVVPPVTMWRREDVAIDVFHLVYVTATAVAYELLD